MGSAGVKRQKSDSDHSPSFFLVVSSLIFSMQSSLGLETGRGVDLLYRLCELSSLSHKFDVCQLSL